MKNYRLIPMSYNYFRFKWFIGPNIIANILKSKNIRHKNLLRVCLPVAVTEIYRLGKFQVSNFGYGDNNNIAC